MRVLLFVLALTLAPSLAPAQTGGIGASVRILDPGGVRLERTPGGARLTLAHASRPLVAIAQRPGDPPCSVTPPRRAPGATEVDVRCTPAPGARIIRLLIVPVA